jgi:hypothetical protein
MSALLQPSRVTALLVALGLLLAACGVRFYAGGWNDGSRLAAVESLVERGTLAIDDSVFVRPQDAPDDHPPYRDDALRQHGTQDKLFIRGHYHSDKPPVVSFVLAAAYAHGRALGVLPSAAERPDLFAALMTLWTSVVAYAVALACLHRLGSVVGLRGWVHTLWLGAFALSTVALAYTRHVNNHVMQLAVVAACLLLAVRMADENGKKRPWPSLLGLGLLLGLGYNLDLGSGPLFFAVAVGLVAWRTRSMISASLVVAAALPWVVACHAVNYAVGGVFGPLNAVPAYFDWPGCPFGTNNMTGVLRHSPVHFVTYALALLFGKHGFVVHNLPLLLCLPALTVLWRPSRYRAEAVAGLLWCGLTWGLYALSSNNYSGACTSVRWFVPFLAPGFLLLAVYLKERPERARDLAVLASWGALLGIVTWSVGPWATRMIPGLWPIVGCAGASWLAVRLWRRAPVVPAVPAPLRRVA